jgi:hypothetical protein
MTALPASGRAWRPPSRSDRAGHGRREPVGAAGGPQAAQLMDEWASCMRTRGEPNQVEPSIDSYGAVKITMQVAAEAMSSEAHRSPGACGQYELAAENALRTANLVGAPTRWIGGTGGPRDVSVANTGWRATGGGPPTGGFVARNQSKVTFQ